MKNTSTLVRPDAIIGEDHGRVDIQYVYGEGACELAEATGSMVWAATSRMSPAAVSPAMARWMLANGGARVVLAVSCSPFELGGL